ncbi:desmocollin 2-like protein isoform X2 [Osmerus eperlanus]|uniref:desmocollin 2-like protein isoform X2 n=1 Tax=Osmerus eperlanus TaxID=29151 RepID=UPI002E0FB081
MAPGGLFCFSLLAVLIPAPVELCVPQSIQAVVPAELQPGYVVSEVPLSGCHGGGRRLVSADPDFAVRADGTIVTTHLTRVMEEGKSFLVWVWDGAGHRWAINVRLLSTSPEQVPAHVPRRARYRMPGPKGSNPSVLRRTKRRWSPLPFNIIENDVPPFPKDVELVGSDSTVNYTVYYEISGPGVTVAPKGLFSVDRQTGMVKVWYAVDREQYSKFVFTARVFDTYTNKETDRPLDITVLVDDMNDNAPTFSGPLEFSVSEQCGPDTEIGLVTATDLDAKDTLHVKIKYSLLSGIELFSIHPESGMLIAKTGNLDREVQVVQKVVVEIRDMNGAKNGLFNTATATVTLVDINDNPPTFREATYKARIDENQADVLVLRIPVDDKDEKKTKNWNAKFVITEGNENGNFRIDTDPETNEGLLSVVKPLDYEKGKVVKMKVTAQNEAPLAGTSASWVSIPLELSVGDVDEGPEFSPPHLVLLVNENTPNGTLLSTYAALDPETKSSAGMRYYRVSDPGSWINVGENTGELKVANTIDLESPLVTNAMYNITIKAVDKSGKSGNGTVTLLIKDVNDNVPKIDEGELVLCEEPNGGRGSVTIVAVDPDLPPYSTPFNFQLPDGHDGKWRLRSIQNNSAVLEQATDMPTGLYRVPVRVSDLQGQGGVQEVQVRVCRCLGGQCAPQKSSATLGVWGVLAMLLALLLLLLLCILFVFACTTKGQKVYIDDSSGGMLLKSNTEAPGEEVKSAHLLTIPPTCDSADGSLKKGFLDRMEATSPVSQHQTGQQINQHLIGQQMSQNSFYQTSRRDFLSQGQKGFYSSGRYGGATYTDAALLKQSQLSALYTWQTNGLYLDKKLGYFGDEAEERYADDLLTPYGYEGEGSPAGSVGCCSDLGDQDNLDFLDSLGSKFKTLANICLDREEDIP